MGVGCVGILEWCFGFFFVLGVGVWVCGFGILV